jgi:hypothetical protein
MADEVAGELVGLIPVWADYDDCIWLMPPPQFGWAEQAQRGLLVCTGEAMQSLNRTLDLSDRLTCILVTRGSGERHLRCIERRYDRYPQDATAEFL